MIACLLVLCGSSVYVQKKWSSAEVSWGAVDKASSFGAARRAAEVVVTAIALALVYCRMLGSVYRSNRTPQAHGERKQFYIVC